VNQEGEWTLRKEVRFTGGGRRRCLRGRKTTGKTPRLANSEEGDPKGLIRHAANGTASTLITKEERGSGRGGGKPSLDSKELWRKDRPSLFRVKSRPGKTTKSGRKKKGRGIWERTAVERGKVELRKKKRGRSALNIEMQLECTVIRTRRLSQKKKRVGLGQGVVESHSKPEEGGEGVGNAVRARGPVSIEHTKREDDIGEKGVTSNWNVTNKQEKT